MASSFGSSGSGDSGEGTLRELSQAEPATPGSGERKDADGNAFDWVRKTWPERVVYSSVKLVYTLVGVAGMYSVY